MAKGKPPGPTKAQMAAYEKSPQDKREDRRGALKIAAKAGNAGRGGGGKRR
jgi:hypothetical protein